MRQALVETPGCIARDPAAFRCAILFEPLGKQSWSILSSAGLPAFHAKIGDFPFEHG